MLTVNLDSEKFPLGAPLPVLFIRNDSQWSIVISQSIGGPNLSMRIYSNGRLDYNATDRALIEFANRPPDEDLFRDVFKWIDLDFRRDVFPTIWDHLLATE